MILFSTLRIEFWRGKRSPVSIICAKMSHHWSVFCNSEQISSQIQNENHLKVHHLLSFSPFESSSSSTPTCAPNRCENDRFSRLEPYCDLKYCDLVLFIFLPFLIFCYSTRFQWNSIRVSTDELTSFAKQRRIAARVWRAYQTCKLETKSDLGQGVYHGSVCIFDAPVRRPH